MDRRRLRGGARRDCWPAPPAPGSPPPRPRPPGTGWRGGRCRRRSGTIELAGLRGRVRVAARPLGRAPRRGRRPPPTSASPRASATARTGSGRWTSTAGSSAAGSPRSPGAEGLPIDRLMRTLGIRRAAEREAEELDPELRRPARALLRRASTRPPRARPALPFEMQLLRLRVRARGGRSTSSASASCSPSASRPTGSGSCCAPTWCARSAPSWRRKLDPDLPGRQPDRHPGSLDAATGCALAEQIDAVRRSIGLADRGQRLQQLGGLRRALGDRLAADRRRPAPAAEHAGHLVPGRPALRRALRPRRLAAGHAGHLHGPEQRRLLDLHQRDGRRPGPLHRADRGRDATCSKTSGGRSRSCARRSPVKGRDQPERARGPQHPPRADRQRGARRRRRRAAGAALARPSTSRPPSPACSSCSRSSSGPELVELPRGPHLAGLEPDLGRPPRLDRLQADRPPAAAQAAAAPTCRSRAGPASSSGRGRSPTTSCRRWSTPRAASSSPPTTGSSATTTRTTSPATGSTASAPRGSSSCCRRATSTTSTSFEAMQTDVLSLPGLEAARRLGRLQPDRPARAQRDRAAAQLGRAARPRHRRRHDLPGLPAAAGARGGAGGDRRPRPRRALARPRRQRLHPPRHLALALALAPDGALGGGRRGADRPALGRARARGAGAAPSTTSSDRFGPDPDGWRWGTVHEMEFPHPLGDANPLLRRLLNRRLRAGGAQETVSQIAYDPNDPYRAVWAPSWRMVADPTAPERSRWQMFTGQSGHPASPPLRRPAGRLAGGDAPSRWRRGALAGAGAGPRLTRRRRLGLCRR